MPLAQLLAPAISAAERGRIPDSMIRVGIRRLLAARRDELVQGGCEAEQRRKQEFIARCRDEPIAAVPDLANEQHYEVPSEFFVHALGRRLKYSCCCWPDGVRTLDEAETAALAQTCDRAQLDNGQSILELGCGWGSLSLWMAERYPESRITAVSNSTRQRDYILRRQQEQGITNLCVVTADMNDFDPGAAFDRVVSVEMFEHLRNHAALMRRIGTWLTADGKLFVHVFCHRSVPYFFEPAGEADWMSRHFFRGGVMPCDDLLTHYQADLTLTQQWRWSGRHYARTANAWLANVDRERDAVLEILAAADGAQAAGRWLQRWRIFFMACAELFGSRDGNEWWISQALFQKRRDTLREGRACSTF